MSAQNRERTGGQESLNRTAQEATQEEETRLGPFQTFSLRHLQLLPSLPDNTWTHDDFADSLPLGQGTEPPDLAA